MVSASGLAQSKTENHHWIDSIHPATSSIFAPLQGCVYENISKERFQKVDANGNRKFYQLTLHTTNHTKRVLYIYSAALELLGLCHEELSSRKRKNAVYAYVKEQLNKLSPESQWKLRLLYPMFQNYVLNEPIRKTLRPSIVKQSLPPYNKRILIQLLHEAAHNTSRLVRYNALAGNLSLEEAVLCTTLWRRAEGIFRALITNENVTIVSPCGRLVGKGTYRNTFQVFNYSVGRTQVHSVPSLENKPKTPAESLLYEKKMDHQEREIKIVAHIHKREPKSIPGIINAPFALLTFLKQDLKRIYHHSIVTQYDYSLYDYCQNAQIPTQEFSRLTNVLKQLFSGLAFLKKVGVIHGDIKPENIFVKGSGFRVVIGDFGGSILKDEVQLDLKNIMQTPFTAQYLSDFDFMGMVNAIITNSKETWTKMAYAHDLSAMALTVLQMMTRKLYAPMTRVHNSKFKKIFKSHVEDMELPAHHSYASLLDLSQFSFKLIRRLLKEAKMENDNLILIFRHCLRCAHQQRPSPSKVIHDLNRFGFH